MLSASIRDFPVAPLDCRWRSSLEPPTPLRIVDEDGITVVEGTPTASLMTSIDDANRVIELCLSTRTNKALLYPSNLTTAFFDLSSREAGEILQKLRNYGVRLAVVCLPGQVQFSTRFGEMLAEEHRKRHFAVFESRAEAWRWLTEE